MSKNYKVKWTSNVKEDLLNIVFYIKQDNVSAARKVFEQIKEKAQSSSQESPRLSNALRGLFRRIGQVDGGMSCGEIALMVRMGREIGKWGDYPITWASISSGSSSSPRKISS
jgi:plasmid stabilization system protein ParE